MSSMTQTDFSQARKAMIDSQLRTCGVNEPFVLTAMSSIARENFVPEKAKSVAYTDRTIPLGKGQSLAPPLFHGKLLAEANPGLDDSCLVIENGSSYLSELLRMIGPRVDAKSIQDILDNKLGRKSYSLILIDGAVEEIPAVLLKRLLNGGKIVTGLVERGVTRLASGRKISGSVFLQPIADLGIPVLQDLSKPKEWSF